MRIEDKLDSLAGYHENIGKCIRVTLTVLAESEHKQARKQFGSKVQKALKAKGDDNERVRLSNGVDLRVTTAAVLDMILKASAAVPVEEIKEMLQKKYNRGKTGQALRVLIASKYIKKTHDGYVRGSNEVTIS